jgi:hypothetical protein
MMMMSSASSSEHLFTKDEFRVPPILSVSLCAESKEKPNRTVPDEEEETHFEYFLGVFTSLNDVTRFIK